MQTPSQPVSALSSPLAARPLVYVPPAEVFEFWLNEYLRRYPGQRPPLEWLSQNSKLPYSTCGDYRKRYEDFFPDLYVLSQLKRNLRAAWRGRRGKHRKRSLPLPEVSGECQNSEVGEIAPETPCTSLHPVLS